MHEDDGPVEDDVTVRCEGCGFSQSILIVRYSYVDLECRRRWSIATALGWCNSCVGITQMEKLPPLEAIRARLEQLVTSGRDEVDEVTGEIIPLSRQIEKQRHRERWREQRSSPRCLKCGSTDAFLVEDPSGAPRDFPHPGCGHEVRFFLLLWSGSGIQHLCTPDGQRVPEHRYDELFERARVDD